MKKLKYNGWIMKEIVVLTIIKKQNKKQNKKQENTLQLDVSICLHLVAVL